MLPVIDIQNLSFDYGHRKAIDQITLKIQPAEIFGLLGPNGGGKSTLFRILCTFLPPQTGSVRIANLNIETQSQDIRKQIGVVFQSGSLDRKLTVEENLVHQGHLYGLTGKRLKERCDQMLQRFGMLERRKELVETLSGGMKRRVEVAKSLLHKPEVLLLDEPSTGLDPAIRLELWNYFDEIRKADGVTVVITTHFMEEAERCDRLAIIDHGKVVALGTPQELRSRVGGEVLSIKARSSAPLQSKIRDVLGLEMRVMNGMLRGEFPNAHDLIPKLIEQFGSEIESVTVGKPTLEDAFIQQTGHELK